MLSQLLYLLKYDIGNVMCDTTNESNVCIADNTSQIECQQDNNTMSVSTDNTIVKIDGRTTKRRDNYHRNKAWNTLTSGKRIFIWRFKRCDHC